MALLSMGHRAWLESSITFPNDAVTLILCFLMKVNGPPLLFIILLGHEQKRLKNPGPKKVWKNNSVQFAIKTSHHWMIKHYYRLRFHIFTALQTKNFDRSEKRTIRYFKRLIQYFNRFDTLIHTVNVSFSHRSTDRPGMHGVSTSVIVRRHITAVTKGILVYMWRILQKKKLVVIAALVSNLVS